MIHYIKINVYNIIGNTDVRLKVRYNVDKWGDDSVLISGSDWRDIEETIYLNSIPGYVDSVKEALEEDRSKCSVYKKGEKW